MKRLLISIAFLGIFINSAFSQEGQPPFNYKKTIWIIHAFEGGQVVYGMTNYYEPELAFITVRNILTKYVYVLENFPPATSLRDLAPEYVLILMNDVTDQSLFIGDRWISDGRKMAIMQEQDFKKLKAILDHRKNTEHTYKQQYSTESLVAEFRKGIKDYPEESEYKLKVFEEGETQELKNVANNTYLPEARRKDVSSSSARSSRISVKESRPLSQHQPIELRDSIVLSPSDVKGIIDKTENESTFLIWGIGLFVFVIVVIWQLKR